MMLAIDIPRVPFTVPWVHFDHGPFGAHGTLQIEGYTRSKIALSVSYSLTEMKIACTGFSIELPDVFMSLFGGGAWGGIVNGHRDTIYKKVQKLVPSIFNKFIGKMCPTKEISSKCVAQGPQMPVPLMQCIIEQMVATYASSYI